jgi:hypothetical protein
LLKKNDIANAAAQYKKCERHCAWAIEHSSSDKNQTVEVKQQLSLCKLNRSLCYYKTRMYHESHKLCMQVLEDRGCPELARCKAGVRAGQSLVKMHLAADEEERTPKLLHQALACADSAQLLCNGDAEFSAAITMLRKEAREKLVEAGFSPAADPSTLPASLADLPLPIPPLLASALQLIQPLHPFPPHILSAAHSVFQRLRAPPPPQVHVPIPLPPPKPNYANYFQRRLETWPKGANGRFLSCAELQADILSISDYILPLRAFAKRWLHQCLCQPPAHNNQSARVSSGTASVQVKAAARQRARGGEAAFLSARLAAAGRDSRKHLVWAAAILERVFSIHCMRVRVMRRKAIRKRHSRLPCVFATHVFFDWILQVSAAKVRAIVVDAQVHTSMRRCHLLTTMRLLLLLNRCAETHQ